MNKARNVIINISIVLLTVLAGIVFVSQVGPRFDIYIFPPSPQRYVKMALGKMENGIYAQGDRWMQAKRNAAAEAEDCKNYEETYALLRKALAVAGGKHSALLAQQSNQSAAQEQQMPTVCVDANDILVITLPPYSAASQEALMYAEKVITALRERSYAGIVVDLRDNVGGDMGPMIAALSPLLPDGQLMSFNIRGRLMPVTLKDGSVYGGGTPLTVDAFKVTDAPIAVLQNELTASSGEMTLLAFRGLAHVKTFGSPSAGYCSCNTSFNLYDGALLQLTTGTVKSRTGEEFCEDAIEPDVAADSPMTAAKEWILRTQSIKATK